MMRTFWRRAREAAIVTLIALMALSGFAYWRIGQSQPDYAGDRPASGLDAVIEIVRDPRAVPHIFAQTEADGYFGLGYAHAQDRLWQMEMRRRLAAGRVTQIVGGWARFADSATGLVGEPIGAEAALLRIDVLARTLNLYGAAEASLSVMGPDAVRALEAYAAGVNARLREVAREGLGRGAPELWMLGVDVEPWRPVDSVAAFKLLSATLSASVFREIERARFAIAQGPRGVADLFPDPGGEAITAPPPFAEAARRQARSADADQAGGLFAALSGALGAPFAPDAAEMGGASNVWAAAGSRSATRAPLLASDPHLGLTAPSIWHIARISFPGRDGAASDVYGAAVPGIPTILLGRNERIAWGMATLYADVGDFYLEQINPANPGEYRTANGWRAFLTREELIPIGGGKAVAVVVRSTERGPVVPLDWPGAAEATPAGHALSLAWTPLARDDRSLEAAMRLARAESVAQAQALTPLVTAPPQTVVVADAEGVGLFTIGRAPLRRADHETKGRLPARAWLPRNAWRGFLPPGQMPSVRDPRGGLVASANNRPSDAPYPRHLGFDWPPEHRIRRLTELLNTREFHTLENFKAIQLDTRSEMAAGLAPLMLSALDAGPALSPLAQEAAGLLRTWTYEMDALRAEPLIFAEWALRASEAMTADQLDELAGAYAGARPAFLRGALSDAAVGARWCDDVETVRRETCPDVVAAAFETSVARLSEAYGARLETWRWGRAHQATHRHTPFGHAPFLGALFNIVQETGGGDHTLFRGQSTGRGGEPHQNVHAGGFRAVYDFADLDRSVFALATGQSGHFLSRHYDDFAEIWRAGDYAPMSLARRDAEAGAVGVMRLEPEDASALRR